MTAQTKTILLYIVQPFFQAILRISRLNSLPLEVIHIISKFQKAFRGAHGFHKIKNRSCELQNPIFSAREEMHLKFHGGSSNGLANASGTG